MVFILERGKYKQLLVYFLMLAMVSVLPARAEPEGIGWIPTWKQGIKEARQTNKPILLVSAAPACGGVSGLW